MKLLKWESEMRILSDCVNLNANNMHAGWFYQSLTFKCYFHMLRPYVVPCNYPYVSVLQIRSNGILLGNESGREADISSAASVLERVLCSINSLRVGNRLTRLQIAF